MLKTLLKKQLYEINRSFFYDAKKNVSRSKTVSTVLIILYALLMVGYIGGMFGFFAFQLCQPMVEGGVVWLYYAIFGLLSVFLGVFGSVFNTFAGLYQATDNDLLLSMPIPVRSILFVRVAGVYLMALMFSGVVMLPTVLVRLIVGGFSFPALLGGLWLTFLLSLFDTVLSCLFGWVVAKIAAKLKNKSFMTVLIALVLLALYFIGYSKASDIIQGILDNLAEVSDAIRGKAYVVYAMGEIGAGRFLFALIGTLIVFTLVVLTYFILDRTFLGIATGTTAGERKKYREKTARLRPFFLTVFSREVSRFLSSATYMLNGGLSTLLTPMLGVFLLIRGDFLVGYLSEKGLPENKIWILAAGMICAVSAMNTIAAASVSIEGKGIDAIRSLPVPTKTVLLSKAVNHLVFTLPAVILASVFAVIGVRPGFVGGLFVFLIPILYTCFISFLQLTINLLLPNLTWTNETALVKQSMSILVSILTGPLVPVLMIIAGIALPIPTAITGVFFSVVFLALANVLAYTVFTWGNRVFENL